MAASNTDKFKKARRRFSTTIDVGGVSAGATSIPLVSTTGLDTDTAITLVLDPGLNTEEVITGVVSGNNIINCVRGKEGTTAQAHTAGAAVAMYFTETHWDDLINGVLVEHNQDGTHSNINATSVTATTGTLTTANLTTANVTTLNVGGASLVPSGSIMQYAGSAAPTGWLIADGSAVSRTTYADLYTAIGTTYGSGNGSTTFNLPDLKGKVPVGKNSSETEFDTLGETGGAKTHTLSLSEIPSHSHQLKKISNVNYTGTGFNPISDDGAYGGANTNVAGGGGAHNNLQPYIVLNYIIKT